jgi:hypothetical protein
VDIVGILNETASKSEEQVCELFKYGRGFQHIARGVGGLGALASLDELENPRGSLAMFVISVP